MWKRYQRTHLGRTMKRFGAHGGNVYAGGIAYHALLSIAAGVVVMSTAAAVLVGRSPSFRDSLLRFVDRLIPGAVSTENSDGLISVDSITSGALASTVGIVAVLIGLNTATRYLGSLRSATQAMLGRRGGNMLVSKLKDFSTIGVLLVFALGAAFVQVVGASRTEWWGDETTRDWVVRFAAFAVIGVADVVFVFVTIFVLGRAKRPFLRLMPVILVVAFAIGVVRWGSTVLLDNSVDNPVLAPFAAAVTLLVWVDLMARLILLGAAWIGVKEDVGVGGRWVFSESDGKRGGIEAARRGRAGGVAGARRLHARQRRLALRR